MPELIRPDLRARGSNENFNGLVGQYFKKRKSLTGNRQSDCDQLATKLNSRPSKRHGFKIPIQRMQELSGVLHLGCRFPRTEVMPALAHHLPVLQVLK